MRLLSKPLSVALGVLWIGLSPVRAAADVLIQTCGAGCVVQPDGFNVADYTVPDDGLLHRWDIHYVSDDPFATLALGAPNEVFSVVDQGTGSGFTSVGGGPFPFTFTKTIDQPGFMRLEVEAPASFFSCSGSTPAGVICGTAYAVWGNAAALDVNSTAPVTLFFTDAVVPEPASWALAILGFAGVGSALRRARSRRPRAAIALSPSTVRA